MNDVDTIKSDIKRLKTFLKFDRWTQIALARNSEKKETTPKSPTAEKFCLVGAEMHLDICLEAKIAIQNASLELYQFTKAEVNDNLNFCIAPETIEYKERAPVCYAAVMKMLDHAFTKPQFKNRLPEPVHTIEAKEEKKEKKKEVILIPVGSSIAPMENYFDAPNMIHWENGPIIWHTKNTAVPLICQLINKNDGTYEIMASETSPDMFALFKDGTVALRDIISIPNNKYWAVITDENFIVEAALELTKKPIPELWLPNVIKVEK